MAEYVVVDANGHEYRVMLIYWWRGREYKNPAKLPEEFIDFVKKASAEVNSEGKAVRPSVYGAFACVEIPGCGVVSGESRCMYLDVPSRAYGRNRALGLLRQKVLDLGAELEKRE